MIVVTLICFAVGVIPARVEFQRRCAVFHEEEADRCESRLHSLFAEPSGDEFNSCVRQMNWHIRIAHQLRAAAPWTVVDESPKDWERP